MIQRAVEVHRIHQRLNSIQAEANRTLKNQIQSGPLPLLNGPGREIESIGNEVNLKLAKRAIELEFVKKALAKNNGIVSRAARELGISRVNLYELIEKHNIGINEFKAVRPRTIRHNTPEA